MTNRELAEVIYNLTLEIQKSLEALKKWKEEKEWESDRTRSTSTFNSYF